VIVHPQARGQALTVVRVEPTHLLVREGPAGRPQALRPGDPLPGCPGWTLAGTVLVDAVHYRYRPVARIGHLDPVLVALEGGRALVEVEVVRAVGPASGVPATGMASSVTSPGPPRRPTLDAALLRSVPIQETGPDRYDVPAVDLQAALAHAGRVLAELAPGVVPTYSAAGVEYRLTSAAGDGVLGRQGFTVWAPKLAERAGIAVGDTILSVNGVPVDGFASLFRIYQQVRRTPALATIQVDLDRGGTRLTKTYRLR
jgi:membrane-associated protease RseP (regulator of RpoE activity)